MAKSKKSKKESEDPWESRSRQGSGSPESQRSENPKPAGGSFSVQAAGTVLWRPAGSAPQWGDDLGAIPSDGSAPSISAPTSDNVEVCLIHRVRYDDWSLPKGHVEAGESAAHTAVRETNEETGIPVRLGAFVCAITYKLPPAQAAWERKRRAKRTGEDQDSLPETVYKQVLYWMGTPLQADVASRREAAFGHPIAKDSEADELEWVPLPRAYHLMSYETDISVLKHFAQLMDDGAGQSGQLVIVRHAKAEPRKSWDKENPDAIRPITPLGAAAAFALAREIACYAPTLLLSSPSRRTLQTLRPYADESFLPLVPTHDLTEEAEADDPKIPENFLTMLLDRLSLAARVPRHAAVNQPITGLDSAASEMLGSGISTPQGHGDRTAPEQGFSGERLDDRARSGSNLDADTAQAAITSPEKTLTVVHRSVAVCTHRPVLDDVLPRLRRYALNESVAGMIPAGSPSLKPGEAVALTVTRRKGKPVIIDAHSLGPVVY